MSDNSPTPDAPPPTDQPPTPPTPDPAPTPAVPPPPTDGASKEVLDAISGLTEIVTQLVNKDAGIAPDDQPVKVPWIYRGSKR